MKHFNKGQWLAYKNNELSLEEKIEMEDHLYTCDKCMEIFLGSIGEEEIEAAQLYIPEDFTENVKASIKNVRPMIKAKKKKKKKIINDYFLYYGAVASVAIILTAGGFFGNMVESVPKISIGLEEKESKVKTNTIFNISESITSKTSDFINNFEIKKIKED